MRIVRIVALLALPLYGAIAAFGTAPESQLLLPPLTALPEPLAIDVEKTLVLPPASFIREERLQRGDTFGGLLSRLGVNNEDTQRTLRPQTGTLRTLRTAAKRWQIGRLP